MKVSVIMGSKSDWDVMSAACQTLEEFGVSYEKKVISAHRTPQFFCEYMASARDRGVGIVIAGAGGAAHLPGMAAAMTSLPAETFRLNPEFRILLHENTVCFHIIDTSSASIL